MIGGGVWVPPAPPHPPHHPGSPPSPAQIILALGNYMNSSKRGAVYGFKLQSLDLVSGTGGGGGKVRGGGILGV